MIGTIGYVHWSKNMSKNQNQSAKRLFFTLKNQFQFFSFD